MLPFLLSKSKVLQGKGLGHRKKISPEFICGKSGQELTSVANCQRLRILINIIRYIGDGQIVANITARLRLVALF